jgi:hypothetical protein
VADRGTPHRAPARRRIRAPQRQTAPMRTPRSKSAADRRRAIAGSTSETGPRSTAEHP